MIKINFIISENTAKVCKSKMEVSRKHGDFPGISPHLTESKEWETSMKTIDKKVLELKKSLVVFPDYSTDLDQMPSLERKYEALSIKIDKTVDQ